MKEIIIVKENIPKIKNFLEEEHINYEIYQESISKFKKSRPVKIDIFADYDKAIKDQELETEKNLLEEDYEEEERNLENYENR